MLLWLFDITEKRHGNQREGLVSIFSRTTPNGGCVGAKNAENEKKTKKKDNFFAIICCN